MPSSFSLESGERTPFVALACTCRERPTPSVLPGGQSRPRRPCPTSGGARRRSVTEDACAGCLVGYAEHVHLIVVRVGDVREAGGRVNGLAEEVQQVAV